MSEAEHLANALAGFFEDPDNGWFSPFTQAIAGLNAAQATQLPAPRFNSVWAVVNHVRFWQEVLLLRLRDETVDRQALGAENGWPPHGGPGDELAWLASCDRARAVNKELVEEIAKLSDEALEDPVSPNRPMRYQAIHGVIAHLGYHINEIISIRHMLGYWMDRT